MALTVRGSWDATEGRGARLEHPDPQAPVRQHLEVVRSRSAPVHHEPEAKGRTAGQLSARRPRLPERPARPWPCSAAPGLGGRPAPPSRQLSSLDQPLIAPRAPVAPTPRAWRQPDPEAARLRITGIVPESQCHLVKNPAAILVKSHHQPQHRQLGTDLQRRLRGRGGNARPPPPPRRRRLHRRRVVPDAGPPGPPRPDPPGHQPQNAVKPPAPPTARRYNGLRGSERLALDL